MRVGLMRRLASFILDAFPIAIIISLLFSLFIGDLLKPANYDDIYAEYSLIRSEYFSDLEDKYFNEEITYDQYQERYNSLVPAFQNATKEQYKTIVTYTSRVVLYHVISFGAVYYIYMALMKGNTLGRKTMKIELGGKVTLWNLFVREILWKYFFWIITLGIGGIILDITMISLSQKKQTVRDYVSKTYIKYEGVDYPF
jgi:formate-dependent nitrite reductase membrane component NrfD